MAGLLLPLLEELEPWGKGCWGGAARRAPRPFRVLSLASRERVRGRPQGRRAGGLGLVARPEGLACRGGSSKRESHGGVPGTRPPARCVRMSVTASMSSDGSIAVGKSGGQPDPPRTTTLLLHQGDGTSQGPGCGWDTLRGRGSRDVPRGWDVTHGWDAHRSQGRWDMAHGWDSRDVP